MIRAWIQRLNDAQQWKRVLAAIAGVLIIVAIWHQLSFTEVTAQKQQLSEEHEKLNQHLDSVKGMTADSGRLLYEKHIISADDLAKLLSSLLQQSKDLELVSLQEVPVVIKDDVPEKVRGLHQVLEQKITATDIVLQVRGSYFSVLRYLKSVEKEAGLGIFWKKIDYVVDKYPAAEVQVVIRTLGTKG
jgi:hypothetical protein